MELKQKAKQNIKQGNLEINHLIRDDLITTNMASSLVNDHDNLNNVIKLLIDVAELVYSDTDPIMDATSSSQNDLVAA